MTEVVHCFIVGHWAVSRELTVTERYMVRSTTNIIEIDNHDERKRPGMSKELYTFFVKTFPLEGDPILDLGSGSGKYICYVVPCPSFWWSFFDPWFVKIDRCVHMNECLLNVYRLVEDNPYKNNLFHFFWLRNGMLAAIEMHRTSIYIDHTTKEKERWSLIENMRENTQHVENSQ